MTSKKGDRPLAEYFIYVPLVLLFVAAPLILHVKSFSGKNILESLLDKQRIEEQLFVNTLIDACFTSLDSQTGRTYHGVIDLTRFTDTSLQNCISQRETTVSLFDPNNPQTPVKTIKTLHTEGMAFKHIIQRYVLVKDQLLRMEIHYA